jgi:hypothetical protein
MITTNILLAVLLVSGVAVLLFVDRFLSRRRSAKVNADFARRVEDGRANSRLHRVGFENRQVKKAFRIGAEVEVNRPGFFSRRREVIDNYGRVIATHYEELRSVEVSSPARLLLTA